MTTAPAGRAGKTSSARILDKAISMVREVTHGGKALVALLQLGDESEARVLESAVLLDASDAERFRRIRAGSTIAGQGTDGS